jgi:DNA-binding MarR family transcriptional regulator/predicted N-acetyltransferase YhbS
MDPRIAAIRRFNRFYTGQIGVLEERLVGGPYTLTETRVLFELGHRDGASAADLARELGLDTGYLSRILARFDRDGLLVRAPAPDDGRKSLLGLTEAGRAALAPLEARSDTLAAGLLARLPDTLAAEVVGAMGRIEAALAPAAGRAWHLRGLVPGDLGWVISRHGAIYAREFGWDATFETLVAGIAAGIMERFDPAREAAWIAERDGVPVGSVFLVRQSDEVAKLRLLIVDPAARGLGIGARLVAECTRFARAAGYRRITLWTHSVLAAARRIYAAEGYRITATGPIHAFGVDLDEETWELDLDAPAPPG